MILDTNALSAFIDGDPAVGRVLGTQPRAAIDSAITLSKNLLTAIIVGFLIVLPLLLLGVGGFQWWRRRY